MAFKGQCRHETKCRSRLVGGALSTFYNFCRAVHYTLHRMRLPRPESKRACWLPAAHKIHLLTPAGPADTRQHTQPQHGHGQRAFAAS